VIGSFISEHDVADSESTIGIFEDRRVIVRCCANCAGFVRHWAYGDNSNLFDVWVMLGAGIVGYVLRKHNYEPAPLVVGLVLGPVMERSLRQTLIISRGNLSGLWDSPICAVMWVVIIMAVTLPPLLHHLRMKTRAHQDEPCS
jgi:TctA family transporter